MPLKKQVRTEEKNQQFSYYGPIVTKKNIISFIKYPEAIIPSSCLSKKVYIFYN